MTRQQVIDQVIVAGNACVYNLQHNIPDNNYGFSDGLNQWFEAAEKFVFPWLDGEDAAKSTYLQGLMRSILTDVLHGNIAAATTAATLFVTEVQHYASKLDASWLRQTINDIVNPHAED